MSEITFIVDGLRVRLSRESAASFAERLRALSATDESPGYAAAALIDACCNGAPADLMWTAREQAELLLALEAWAFAGGLPDDVAALRQALAPDMQAA